jgi:FixJ family two-component response regulator
MTECSIHVPIIFVSGFGDVPTSVSAMKAGAVDFLSKPYDAKDLLDAVAKAIQKDIRYLASKRQLSALHEHFGLLTSREREIFAAVAAGLLNKQVADELGIAEKTVKVHRARVMEKMHAVALADLVRMADLLQLRWNSPVNTAAYAGFAGQFPQV